MSKITMFDPYSVGWTRHCQYAGHQTTTNSNILTVHKGVKLVISRGYGIPLGNILSEQIQVYKIS